MRGGGSGSEGEEEEGRYMVDFTRKIVEEVCVREHEIRQLTDSHIFLM